MVAHIIGFFWILMGFLFFLKPQILRNKLEKKSFRKMRKYFLGMALILGCMLIGVSWKAAGIWPKVIMILGIVVIIKGVFFLNAKVAEKLAEWSRRQPLVLFRIGAVIYITIGVIIYNFK